MSAPKKVVKVSNVRPTDANILLGMCMDLPSETYKEIEVFIKRIGKLSDPVQQDIFLHRVSILVRDHVEKNLGSAVQLTKRLNKDLGRAAQGLSPKKRRPDRSNRVFDSCEAAKRDKMTLHRF